jgi:zinc protease
MPRKSVWIILPFFFLAFSSLYSFDLSRLTFTNGIHETVLPNGLRVLVKEEHSIPLVGIALTYRVGFRNEDTNGRTGLTHLVEHMMFKGTTNYGKGAIARTLSDIGARFNAYTTWDRTSYWEVLPKAGLETAMRVEADRMTNSLFDPAEFELEKKVVLSEISKYYSNPGDKLYKALYHAAYGNHPMSYLSGEIADVKNADRDWVYREIYRRYYRPDNAYLIITGDVKPEDAFALALKLFGGYNAGPVPEKRSVPPLPVTNGVVVRVEGSASEDFGRALFPLPKLESTNRESLALLFLSESGALEDFSYDSSEEGGQGEISFTKDPDFPAETVDADYIRSNFNMFRDTWLSREAMGYDTVQSMLMSLVHWENHGGWREYARIADGLASLTSEELLSAMRKYLGRTNANLGYFHAVKRDMKQKPTEPGATRENFSAGITAGEYENPDAVSLSNARVVNAAIGGDILGTLSNYLSTVRTARLSNGITLLYKPFTLNEKTTVTIGFRGGSASQVKPFQAEYLRHFLFEGGPAQRLLNRLEESGANYWGQADFNTLGGGITLPDSQFSNAVTALRLSVADRVFPYYLLEEEKDRAIKSLEKLDSNPSVDLRASIALDRIAFGGKGDGLDSLATKDDILALDTNDIDAFYTAVVRPENAVITVVGRVSFEDALAAVEREFGGWKQRPALMMAVPALLPVPGKDTRTEVTIPGAQQSVVLMAAPGAPYTDSTNYTAFMLGTRVFGGGILTSRLIRTIRDQRGLTYGVFTYPMSYGDESLLMVYMQNNPENVDKALSLYQAELERYLAGGPSEMEILKFQDELYYSQLFDFEGSQKIASQIGSMQLRRGKPDFLLDFVNILRGLTKEQVAESMRKYMPHAYFQAIAGGEAGDR